MNRRRYLALLGAGGLGTVAGCLGLGDDGPDGLYDADDRESLLPDEVGPDWPDEEFERDEDLYPRFERAWASEDGAVGMDVKIGSVEHAKEVFENDKARVADPTEYPLADEAFVSDNSQIAQCIFRHSNAHAGVIAQRRSAGVFEPDRQRATRYAELMFESW